MLSAIASRFFRSSNRLLRCPALSRVIIALLAAFALACAAAVPASAATTTYWWNASTNPGNWSPDANWSNASNGVSTMAWDTSGDYAIFSDSNYTYPALPSAGTATLTTSTTALGINFAGGSTTIAANYGVGGGSMTLIGNIVTGSTTAFANTSAGPITFDSSLGTLGMTGNSTWSNSSGQSIVVNCAPDPEHNGYRRYEQFVLPCLPGKPTHEPLYVHLQRRSFR